MKSTGSEDFRAEIQRLQRRCRRLEFCGFALVFGVGLGVMVAATSPPQRTIEAQEFVVRDEAGRVAVRLGRVHDGLLTGMGLEVYDREEKLRAALTATSDAPIFVLKDAAGKQGVTLGAWSDGSALSMYGRGDKKLIWLGVSRQRIPLLSLQDIAERTRAEMTVNDERGPLIVFYDSKGEVLFDKP